MNPEPNAAPASTGGIIWTLARRLSMVLVLTLAFFLSAVVTIYIMFRSGDTRVPDLIGKSEVEARSIMEGAKFEIKIQRRTDDAPVNTVIETRPSPNSSVKSSSLVTIVVSSGPAQNKSQFDKEVQKFLVSGFDVLPDDSKYLVSESTSEALYGRSSLTAPYSNPPASQAGATTEGRPYKNFKFPLQKRCSINTLYSRRSSEPQLSPITLNRKVTIQPHRGDLSMANEIREFRSSIGARPEKLQLKPEINL